MTSPIENDTLRYFLNIASWQSIFAILLLILTFAFFISYKKSKRQHQNQKKLFLVSFLLGILIGIIFFIIYQLTKSPENPFPNNPDFFWRTWEDEVNSLLTIATSVYFSLLFIIIPLFIFSSLIVTVNKNRHNSKIGAKAFIVSFLSLLLMAVIGVSVAILLTPLIKMINLPAIDIADNQVPLDLNNLTIPEIINSAIPSSLSIFLSLDFILSIVFVGLFISFLLKLMHKQSHHHGENVIRFFEHIAILLKKYIFTISKLLPYVIITRIPLIFIGDAFQNFYNLFLFIVVFLIGWVLINLAESTIAISMMDKRINQKQSSAKLFSKTIKPYWIEALTKVNSSTLMPYTIETSLKLNADKEMANFTPALGTTMGQSMCAAFYPTLIALMSANLSSVELSLQFYFVLIIIVLITNIGVTGIPGADSTLNLIVLSTLGLTPGYYFNCWTFLRSSKNFR